MAGTWTGLFSQSVQANAYSLKLSDPGTGIENTILLDLSPGDYRALQITTGEKIRIRARQLIVNGDSLDPEELETRGQSTLQFKRKSLGFKLESGATLRHGDKTESLKKFSVLNLAMDKYYCHNRLAFGMMEQTGLFDLFYSFSELRVNGKSEGIFMAIERPEDWAIRKKNSPLILRRGYGHKIEKLKTDNKIARSETKRYLDYYDEIYRNIGRYQGEELYNKLALRIDMDNYMKWLAFNYIVHNGDYSDEVFFYIDPETDKFRVIPWDYDDIFALFPHEGRDESKKVIGDKLIFSVEDLLDRKIATDPYLYAAYLNCLEEVLKKLTPEVLKQVFEVSFAELCPYYKEEEIIKNVQFDLYKDANTENLKNYLITIYIGLVSSRDRMLQTLEGRDRQVSTP